MWIPVARSLRRMGALLRILRVEARARDGGRPGDPGGQRELDHLHDVRRAHVRIDLDTSVLARQVEPVLRIHADRAPATSGDLALAHLLAPFVPLGAGAGAEGAKSLAMIIGAICSSSLVDIM